MGRLVISTSLIYNEGQYKYWVLYNTLSSAKWSSCLHNDQLKNKKTYDHLLRHLQQLLSTKLLIVYCLHNSWQTNNDPRARKKKLSFLASAIMTLTPHPRAVSGRSILCHFFYIYKYICFETRNAWNGHPCKNVTKYLAFH